MDSTSGNNATQKPLDASQVLSREAQILGGGLINGIGETARQSAKGALNFVEKFSSNPLTATGDYLKGNWQAAAGGAALGFLAPEGMFSKLLVAFSLRGIARDTVHAAELGTNRSISVSQAKRAYSTSLAHDGTSFISSLPLTLAGGYLGRLGADALVGKGNGLLDLIPRRQDGEWIAKVSPADVRANITDIGNTIRPKPLKILFTDNDNTLIDFSSYFARGVEKAVPQMAQKLQDMGHPIPENDLWQSLGAEMDKARSHDYPWVVELALKDKLHVGKAHGMPVLTFTDEIVKPFWETIDQSLNDNLRVMPKAAETLAELHQRGIFRVIVSDAPGPTAVQRIVASGLNDHVDEVYALNNIQEPTGLSDELLANGRERVAAHLALANQLPHFEMVPKAWEKPSPNTFKMVMERQAVEPRQAMMIDDSRTKGVQGAWNAGMRATWAPGSPANAIWAEYGNPDAEIEGLLERLRPLPEKGDAPATAVKTYIPAIETAKDFSAVLNHTNPRANYAWLGQRTLSALKVTPPLISVAGWNLMSKNADLHSLTSRSPVK